MNEISLYSQRLGKEITFKSYDMNGMTILSAPFLRHFFDTDPAFKDYSAISALDYCDATTTIYHCDIMDKNNKLLVRGVGDTHSDTLPNKMHDCRSKLAETRAFSDAITRFLELPFQAYTDAQMLEAHTTKPVSTSSETAKPVKATSTEPENISESKKEPETENPYRYEDNGEEGFVSEDTLVGFGAYKDKTIGYIIEHQTENDIYNFLSVLNQKKINPKSTKKSTVVAKYLVENIDFSNIQMATPEETNNDTTDEKEDNSLLQYRYEDNGEEGFVSEDTLVGFGAYKDKTVGYILNHKNEKEISVFLSALSKKDINPVSIKKPTVVAKYLVAKSA